MEFSVVIIDPDTHELLYMNQAQRQELGLLPDAPTWIGAAIIMASGLYLLARERVHAEAEHP